MQNKLSVTPYKGTRDFYPEDMEFRNWMFGKFKDVLKNYAYEEYNGPVLESLDLYAAKSGIELVTEQTYNFEDKSGRRLAIRPEMTPTVSRMIAAKANELTFPVRWFSIANFYRYERPQKGRLREHYQVNVDLFGSDSITADIEILSLIINVLNNYGATSDMFKIRINNRRFFNDVLCKVTNIPQNKHIELSKIIDRREKIDRESYIEELKELGMDDESIDRLEKMYTISLEEAIAICPNSVGATELKNLFSILYSINMSEYCEFDFSIVRGLDYYTGTVFEVYDKSTENKRALFGGGRYDNLVGLFDSNKQISGIGFGCGDVTLENFLKTHNLVPKQRNNSSKLMILNFPGVDYNKLFALATELRSILPVTLFTDEKKLGKQIDYALKNNYDYIAILGEDELKDKIVVIKNLKTREEVRVPRDNIFSYFNYPNQNETKKVK
ncbi:MAG: histidine--tRNA ligase [bacterium]|nr:histidine--tRNA ligase [bacterium]